MRPRRTAGKLRVAVPLAGFTATGVLMAVPLSKNCTEPFRLVPVTVAVKVVVPVVGTIALLTDVTEVEVAAPTCSVAVPVLEA